MTTKQALALANEIENICSGNTAPDVITALIVVESRYIVDGIGQEHRGTWLKTINTNLRRLVDVRDSVDGAHTRL